MKRIVYIGLKDMKADNVAGTRLIWTRGEVHEVEDEAAAKLLKHPIIWADADEEYSLMQAPTLVDPEPRISVIPQDATSPFWEPVVIQVPEDVFHDLQAHKRSVMFLTPAEAQSFALWKEINETQYPEHVVEDTAPKETGPIAEKPAETKAEKQPKKGTPEYREWVQRQHASDFNKALESATKKVA